MPRNLDLDLDLEVVHARKTASARRGTYVHLWVLASHHQRHASSTVLVLANATFRVPALGSQCPAVQ